jgi:hypothetical protein
MTHEPRPEIAVPGMIQLPSGLIVPTSLWHRLGIAPEHLVEMPAASRLPGDAFVVAAPPPSDLDVVWVHPDPDVLGVHAPSLEAIKEVLSEVPVEPAMFGLAGIAAAAWHAGTDQAKHLALAEEIFIGRPVLDRLQAFAREDRRHLIFSEQQLAILVRLLLLHGAEGPATVDLTDAQVDALLIAMLAVTGLTSRFADPEYGVEQEMGWVPWLVRSGLYFDRSNLGSDQARARALFCELAQEADRAGANWCELASWMEQDVAPFEDQIAFGYALGAFSDAWNEDVATTDRFIGVRTDGLLEGNMSPETVAPLVADISANREEFCELFRSSGEGIDHVLWDRVPFEQHPFLRLKDGRLVLVSPRFLHSWMGEGIYFRLLTSAMNRPDPTRPSKQSTLRFTRFHGELMEAYVRRVAEISHTDQTRAGVVTISPEVVYQGPQGEKRSPDLALSYATDIVAVEVTAGRPARRTRVLSDPGLIEKELDDRVIGKLVELDRALQDVLSGRVEIPGVDLSLLERVWPLLIVPSSIIQSEIVWAHIHDRAPGLFASQPSFQRPTLMSIDDFERAMAIVETGAALPALLEQRARSPFATMPPSHFFARHYPNVGRPKYVDSHLLAVGEDARAALGLG